MGGNVHKVLLATSVPLCRVLPPRLYSPWVRYHAERAWCLYTKIGQWVASRSDIFPHELTTELQKLQTNALPMSSTAVGAVLEESGLTFDAIDTVPISSGSIAHVHRGTYCGKDVAVKVQRPGLLHELEDDTEMIGRVLHFVLRGPFSGGMSDDRMYDDMMKTLTELVDSVKKETDFEEEGRHMERYRAFFDANGDGTIRVPRVVVSCRTVLVMEYVPSSPFSGDASRLMKLFYDQFFSLGYLHTDLHGGNIGVSSNGKLVLYDFGSVIRIPSDTVVGMKALIVSYLNKNTELMLEYMFEYGIMRSSGRRSDIPQEELDMLESFIGSVLSYIEITSIDEFSKMMRTTPLTSPTCSFANHIFIIVRSFTLLEGYCKRLDPDFVILDAVMPLASSFANDPLFLALKIEDDLRHVDKSIKTFFRREYSDGPGPSN